jgi:hypothetical protein
MSARSATGASHRSDLFSARSEINTGRESKYDEYDGKQQEPTDEQNPLQIEHMLGYAGDYRKTILASPSEEGVFMKRSVCSLGAFCNVLRLSFSYQSFSLGSLVSIENLNDPHSQIFLRGHDMPVCALYSSFL